MNQSLKKILMWSKVNELSQENLNDTQISIETGLDRRTIKKYRSSSLSDISHKTRTYNLILGPYSQFVKELLENRPYLSSAQIEDRFKENYPNVNPPCEKTFYNFVNHIRKEYGIPKVNVKTARETNKLPETPYGEEAQVDFGEAYMNTSEEGTTRIKVWFMTISLSRSRYKFVYFLNRPFTSATAIYAHELAFKYFGGIPKKIIYDQDRVFIKDENLGDYQLTHLFEQFCLTQPFEVVFCRKADPQSKGKIENIVKYVKINYLRGRDFTTITNLNDGVIDWLERTGNGKRHKGTYLIPSEEMDIERNHLLPYEGNPLFPKEDDKRIYTIRKDNTVLYRSTYYSVPSGTYRHNNTKIKLLVKDDLLWIFDLDDALIAEHKLSYKSGNLVQNTDHKRDKSKSLKTLEDSFISLFEGFELTQDYLVLLKNKKDRFYRDNLVKIEAAMQIINLTLRKEVLEFCYSNEIVNGYYVEHVVNKFRVESKQTEISVDIDNKLDNVPDIASMSANKSNINTYENIVGK